jgi:polysaccharide biosynthesis PFTS motif protein
MSKSFSMMNYSKTIVGERLLQEYCALELVSFRNNIAKGYFTYKGNVTVYVNSNQFLYRADTRELTVTNRYLAKKIISFVVVWNSLLFLHFYTLFSKKKVCKNSTLVYGVSLKSGMHSNFINFCQHGKIDPLKNSNHLIVESSTGAGIDHSGNISFCKNPLYALILSNSISFLDFLSFFYLHVKYALLYFYSVIKYPLMVILGDDFAHQSTAEFINSKDLIKDILITNSNMERQLLWMSDLPNKSYSLHMALYSQNAPFAFVHKDDGIISDLSEYRGIRADNIWVWTKYFANHLKSIGVDSKFHVIGPIMWYLPEGKVQNPRSHIVISVFDVSPKSDSILKTIGYENIYMYYSLENMSRFLLEIIKVVNFLEMSTNNRIEIVLKHKKECRESDNSQYFDLVRRLVDENKVTLVKPHENIFSVISNSDVVVSFPYTSTAYIADHMGIPSIYFDPVKELIPVYEETKGITFSSGASNLLRDMNVVLSKIKV